MSRQRKQERMRKFLQMLKTSAHGAMRCFAAACAALTPLLVSAAEPLAPLPALPPGLGSTVSRGLDFLVLQQGPDGALAPTGPRIAITGLGLLAFLAAGHTPDSGKYGEAVRRAEEFLVQAAPPDGYFGRVDGSRMYGQGIATLALAEAWGVEPSAQRRKSLGVVVTKAAELVLTAQSQNKPDSAAGGWRYEPNAPDSDISLSGWNALALRACRDSGLAIPKESVARAVQFVLKCHVAQGGFAYQPGNPATVSSTGAGVLCLYLLDAVDHTQEIADGLKFLLEHPIDDSTRYPYYSMYYAMQAAAQAGDVPWQKVSTSLFDRLFKAQQPDGGWPQSSSGDEPGRTYATAMALLTVTTAYRLLPIYQR